MVIQIIIDLDLIFWISDKSKMDVYECISKLKNIKL